jgi:hypothetical protein
MGKISAPGKGRTNTIMPGTKPNEPIIQPKKFESKLK